MINKYISLQFILFILISNITNITSAAEVQILHISRDKNSLSWSAFGVMWNASVTKDTYFGSSIPLISLSVTTGDETPIRYIDNCFYRGVLTDQAGSELTNSTVFFNQCGDVAPLLGFVALENNLYVIEKDPLSKTGISMNLQASTSTVDVQQEILDSPSAWKEGGSGGALSPGHLVSRGANVDKFPSLDIYVNPSYISQVGEQMYIYRIIESVAGANIIYKQSGLKQIHLLAIVRLNQEVGPTDSQGDIIHGMERIRKYIAQSDSTDVSAIYSGEDFDMPYLWGWSEIGYACELEQAVAENVNINTHQVGQSASAIIDRPTVIQRSWVLAHEIGHTLGMTHIYGDPLAYGTFQASLAFKDYVAGCAARSHMYETCQYDPQTKKFTDFYACP